MRPSLDVWALKLASLTAQRTTCLRRAVGCVLLNSRGHVLATGYNGVATGLPHCNHSDQLYLPGFPHTCSGAHSPSGANLDGCLAIHAEQNALLQCSDVYKIHICYTTASPCLTCTKLLLNTSCERIVFVDEYPHSEAKDLWVGACRTWEQVSILRLGE